jgi:hypothetical protein
MGISTVDDVTAESAPVLAPLQQADLPARTLPFWKMTGPSAVLVGLSIGAGELIIWPRMTAEFGAGMTWAAVLGVFVQLWATIEVGRWTIATGETAYSGFARLWRGFGVFFMLFNFFGWFFPGWARVSGTALKALTLGPQHPSPDWVWTALTFVIVALVLFGPKKIYAATEKAVSLMVITITLGLLVLSIKLGRWRDVGELGRGMINFGYRAPGFSVKDLFIAIVFAGAGGTANLFYSFYVRDKRIGMGGRMPMLLNPFRKREQAEARGGYIFPETPENAARFRDWLKFVILDQTLYFWLLNTFTILLFIFVAQVALHPRGIVPQQGTLLWDEAVVMEHLLGVAGRYLFLIIGLATLFSTELTLVDGVSRSMADILHNTWRPGRRISEPAWYAGWAWFMMFFGVSITFILERYNVSDLGFLFNAAYMGGFAMAMYVPLTLYMNLTRLPRSARPHWINIVMVSIAAALYVGFAIYCIWYEAHTRGWV